MPNYHRYTEMAPPPFDDTLLTLEAVEIDEIKRELNVI